MSLALRDLRSNIAEGKAKYGETFVEQSLTIVADMADEISAIIQKNLDAGKIREFDVAVFFAYLGAATSETVECIKYLTHFGIPKAAIDIIDDTTCVDGKSVEGKSIIQVVLEYGKAHPDSPMRIKKMDSAEDVMRELKHAQTSG